MTDVAYAPEEAADWVGRKAGDAEQDVQRFDDHVERKFDHAVTDVEYAPEEAADWAGSKVRDVERFGDGVEGAHDQGKDEGRSGYGY